MKVLFNTYPMAFHTVGGGEVQLLSYERHLRTRGVDVQRFDLWEPRFLEHDLVHFFSCIGGSSHFCAFVKQLGLPLVVSSSLWMTEDTMSGFPADEIRHQLALADRVVTNSTIESVTLARLLDLPRSKFVEVPNAVEERFLQPASGDEFRARFPIEGRPFALCVANIEPRKNQLRLIQAVLEHTDLDLVLVGGIRDTGYWNLVSAMGGERLHFTGPMAHDSSLLISAYAACEVFVLPSLFETPGLAALEASGQRARLALTGNGSTREYFGSSAHYADPLSVHSIATAINAARRSAASRFVPATWSGAAERLAGIYEELLAADVEPGPGA